jgi:cell division protein FtsB
VAVAERRRAAAAERNRRPAGFSTSRHATKTAVRRGRRRDRRADASRSAATLTRMERRQIQERRRTRTMVIGSALLAILVLVAWFPGGPLLQQHAALAATDSAFGTLQREDAALASEQKNLNSPSEIERIARQQYDLVLPGQAAFQVLPPNGAATDADAPYPGDPGLAAPVTPSGAPELPPSALSLPAATHNQHAAHRASHPAAAAPTDGGSLLSRIVRTLEFWR